MVKSSKQTALKALAFLDEQRLDPTPRNYELAYRYHVKTCTGIGQEIDDIIESGCRLTQTEADRIMAENCVQKPTADSSAVKANGMDHLRHHILRLADIASNQSLAASRFGRDLSEGMNKLGESNTDLAAIIATMIKRTECVERELAASAAEAERLRQDLETARNDANKDALTDLLNRRAADGLLKKLEQSGRVYTIAFCDIDFFKKINDSYGHVIGDRVLKAIAEILSQTCSEYGTVARWGGEEFVAIFERATPHKAAQLIDSARQRVSAKHFKVRENNAALGMLSFSAGIASGSGPAAAITAEADKLLYHAKETGRNKVVSL